ncbi:amino acid/amide ABC transporter substrate-binding protein (HAAT family) [Rhodopseudomonas thermotolerans]|uniref:Amino acid/amide ABC transporter substrate-binding protein (HAAT family) n=2 Tax=Rhodopseudomonas TaxID=1073 RepID=A0A336JSF8_9BRAD|nr:MULTISPECIES: ABC transporter substrate-binding protein [Rhodopseudomonas]RED29076.1 amino acid/amide ABC transporter substrate-binding protein (HAAT family) [Rhodopseudomonas pentothenatexigens]REF92313.1 amino acid/amide ABC transporter substrate-binding protein (HAAT family) [Rhodopseudomonas thermotolerans]SSW92488.1 amino acid/amide ABC transporter substrate-binding protein (HAAT family) [Rhodopseudomonas pentothenatexigens]
MSLKTVAILVTAVVALATPVMAEDAAPGVTATSIKLGNTAPYSGPASAYATIAKAGLAYFDMINQAGGIHGRKVEIISLDDAFTPPKAVEQTRKLVDSDNVLAIFLPIGTPTSAATQAYLNSNKVPQLLVSSGASRWNQPRKFPWTVGWNVDYVTEGRIYAKYILANVKEPKIALLYQNDDYGKDILAGLKQGLGDQQAALVQAATYELSDPTVDSPIAKLRHSGANVFISATTPKFAAQSIKVVDQLGWKPLFVLPSVSNSVDPVLTSAGLDKSAGIISTSYVKQPTDPQWQNDPDFKTWSAFMDKYYPSGSKKDWLNAYAYGMSYVMHQALEKAGKNLTRETLMAAMESVRDLQVPMLIPGITATITKDDHGPLKAMQMMKFNGESWEPLGGIVSAD